MKIFMISLMASLSFISYSSWANTGINEYKTDLYYANGMGMKLSREKAERDWHSRVKKLKKANPEQLKNTTPKISYNSSTLFGVDDFMESLLQWLGQPSRIDLGVNWSSTNVFNSSYLELALGKPIELSQALNFIDLNRHITAYEHSIESGRGVIVVAHSQGNFLPIRCMKG